MRTRYFPIICIYPSSHGENFVPLICLSGRWLENACFMTGDEINVRVLKHGELLITLLPEIGSVEEDEI